MDIEELRPIRKNQNGNSNQFFFKGIQGLLALGCPLILSILVQQFFQWNYNLGIILDEPSVVSCLTQGGVHLVNWSGGHHIQYDNNLSWIHKKSILFHDVAQQYNKGCTCWPLTKFWRILGHIWPFLGLRHLAKDGAQREAENRETRPIFGSL